jgi:hypothetical protein
MKRVKKQVVKNEEAYPMPTVDSVEDVSLQRHSWWKEEDILRKFIFGTK